MEAESITFDDEPQEVAEAPVEAAQAESEGTPESTPEPESAPEEAPKPVTFSEEQQAFINEKIVGKKVAAQREAERRAQELEQRLQELEQKYQPPEEDPEPNPPEDVWSDDYEQRMAKFKADHADWAKREVQREFQAQEAQRIEYEKAQEAQRAHYEQVVNYTERAEKLGISSQELQVAGNAVEQFGIAPELVNHLLKDDLGPLVTTYLAKNLTDLQALQQMDPISAGIYIATEIKPKVSRSMKRKAPPEPVEPVKGSSVPEKERGPKGAVYE